MFVGLMVVCEAISHCLSERKDQLLALPRQLSSRQFEKLVSELRLHPQRKVGVCTLRNREAEIFARQFLRAFKEAGWEANFVLTDLPENEMDSGVLFLSFEGNTPPSRPDFSLLETAFAGANISYKMAYLRLMGVYTNGISTNDPVVLIGKRFEY